MRLSATFWCRVLIDAEDERNSFADAHRSERTGKIYGPGLVALREAKRIRRVRLALFGLTEFEKKMKEAKPVSVFTILSRTADILSKRKRDESL